MQALKYIFMGLGLCTAVMAKDRADHEPIVHETKVISQADAKETYRAEGISLLTKFIGEQASDGKEIYKTMHGKNIRDLEPRHLEHLLDDIIDYSPVNQSYYLLCNYFYEWYPNAFLRWCYGVN